jgi:hypothetical protein
VEQIDQSYDLSLHPKTYQQLILHVLGKDQMPTFKCGEKVRIIDGRKESYTSFTIKDIKKGKDGTVLYLLKSQEDSALRLYYESKETLLERIS